MDLRFSKTRQIYLIFESQRQFDHRVSHSGSTNRQPSLLSKASSRYIWPINQTLRHCTSEGLRWAHLVINGQKIIIPQKCTPNCRGHPKEHWFIASIRWSKNREDSPHYPQIIQKGIHRHDKMTLAEGSALWAKSGLRHAKQKKPYCDPLRPVPLYPYALYPRPWCWQ